MGALDWEVWGDERRGKYPHKSRINPKKLIGDFDLLIASTCLHHNLTLLTNNRKHYKMVEGLKILSLL
jgi:predicted nucleic acid-binding protein